MNNEEGPRPWNVETTAEQDQAERDSWTSQADEDRSYLTARALADFILRRPNYDVPEITMRIIMISYLPDSHIWAVEFEGIITAHYGINKTFSVKHVHIVRKRNGQYAHAWEEMMRFPGEGK
jgi:hypothetical protein